MQLKKMKNIITLKAEAELEDKIVREFTLKLSSRLDDYNKRLKNMSTHYRELDKRIKLLEKKNEIKKRRNRKD